MILGFLNNIWDAVGTYMIYETDKNGKKKVVMRFNTIEECLYRSSSQVVSYPTEEGILATDYKYDELGTINLKGVLKRSTLTGKAINAGVNFLTGQSIDTSSISSLTSNLEYYKSGMYALNIQTKTSLYENYTLQDFEIPEDYDNYGILEVIMTFKQINKVGNKKNVGKSDSDTVPAGIVRLVGLS